MLHYSPWKTEQTEFDTEHEIQIEEQLAFSNGYISQYAFFDEPYSGPQRVGTFIEGLQQTPGSMPQEIPNPVVISLRLDDERLDLDHWSVEKFYRCLHKGEAMLERTFTAVSPKGFRVEVVSKRQLDVKNPHILHLDYTVKFVNYKGLISFMALLGDATRTKDWYPLQTSIDEEVAYMWLQASEGDMQVCIAQQHELLKNGKPQTERAIKIDKKRIMGYAYMTDVAAGDSFTMKTNIAIVDSRRFQKSKLPLQAVEKLGLSL